MKRWLFLLLAILGWMVALVAQSTSPVLACSVGPDFDLVRDSEVIVGGRFSGWKLGEEEVLPPAFYDSKESNIPVLDYATVVARMKVDRVYKGVADYEIEITSGNTLQVYDHEPKYIWIGPAGACGAFGSDPTGKYAIMGLNRSDEGELRAGIFSWFYSGEEPPSDFTDRRLSKLAPLLPGDSPHSSFAIGFPWSIGVVAGILAVPVALALGAALLKRAYRPTG